MLQQMSETVCNRGVRAPLLYKQLVIKLSRDSSICMFVLMAKERDEHLFMHLHSFN